MEIGSEFEWVEYDNRISDLSWLPKGKDRVFTLSGRTAIETVLENIDNHQQGKRVMLPAYCCDSMIEPFVRWGYECDFFSVEQEKGGVKVTIDRDKLNQSGLLLVMGYFGYFTEYPMQCIEEFQNNGGIVIEDITHSLLSEKFVMRKADWYVASLRKWGALADGGFCCCNTKEINKKPMKNVPAEYLHNKIDAMKKKRSYLFQEPIDKKEFLDMFEKANQFLEENYTGVLMSEESMSFLKRWNIDKIRKVRRENAHILHDAIRDIAEIRALFDEKRIDCPLFVPIVAKSEKRDLIRKRLIDHEIYCPIHWPKPKKCHSGLYEAELSLVCDQRYTKEDMERIANVLRLCNDLI